MLRADTYRLNHHFVNSIYNIHGLISIHGQDKGLP